MKMKPAMILEGKKKYHPDLIKLIFFFFLFVQIQHQKYLLVQLTRKRNNTNPICLNTKLGKKKTHEVLLCLTVNIKLSLELVNSPKPLKSLTPKWA